MINFLPSILKFYVYICVFYATLPKIAYHKNSIDSLTTVFFYLSRKDGGKLAKLNLKQQKFADEYIISGNIEQSALNAGYSANYSRSQSHKLLANVGIKSYINERMKEIESKKTATQQEVIEYLTSVMRGEHKEEILIGQGQGFQEITYIDVSAKDRLKAANLLNKIHQARESKQDETKKEDKLDAYIAKVDGELDEFI